MPHPIVIVGAGPAGLMAAIAAARAGASVLVLEQLPRPGTKLLVTGGGRCNLTNTLAPEAFMARCGRQGRFMAPALAALDAAGLRDFFQAAGVPSHTVDGVHVFPEVESARAVLDALLKVASRSGVELRTGCVARRLLCDTAGVTGLETEGGVIPARAVILATGGSSYPQLGATGSGYGLARQQGHTIVPPLPALVPLLTRDTWPWACAGVALPRVRAWIDLPRRHRQFQEGECLFTHRGLSGPAVLNLSGDVSELLAQLSEVPIRLALFPQISRATWAERLDSWRQHHGKRLLRNLLDEALPASLASAITAAACSETETIAARLSGPQRERLLEFLEAAPLTITGTEGFAKAIVTRGGVSLKELHSNSLESRLVPHLFVVGELADLDGPCGGYNLQWAFSSGWLAGHAAARQAE